MHVHKYMCVWVWSVNQILMKFEQVDQYVKLPSIFLGPPNIL